MHLRRSRIDSHIHCTNLFLQETYFYVYEELTIVLYYNALLMSILKTVHLAFLESTKYIIYCYENMHGNKVTKFNFDSGKNVHVLWLSMF